MALRSSEEFRREETSESSLGARCEGLGCYLRQHGAPMRFRSPLKSYTLKTLYLPALAGAAGFEPAHGGTKSRCLTTWLRPNRGRTLVPARSTGKSPGRQRARANWCAKRAGPRQITLAEEPARRYTPRRWFRSVAQLGRALSSGDPSPQG